MEACRLGITDDKRPTFVFREYVVDVIETRWRAHDPADPDIDGQQPAQTPGQRQKLRLSWSRRTRIGVGQCVDWNVGMGYLPDGMHAGVGAPRRSQPHRSPKHRRERILEQACHRALT